MSSELNATPNLSADSASLRKYMDRLSGRLEKLEAAAARLSNHRDRAVRRLEEAPLKRAFWIVLAVLGVASVASEVAIVTLLGQAQSGDSKDILILSTVSGLLGSAIAAILSLLERRANGFEFSDGSKCPVGGKQDRFSDAMCPFFLARPLLGAGVGLLLGAGIWSAILWPGPDMPSVLALCFATVLGGFLAKTALDKLKGIFSNLLGLK